MKNRFICATLAVVMLLSVFAVGPFQARAESNLTISAQGEAMIKAFEGINWQPKWDNKQASVGYGCSVTDVRWNITDPNDPQYVPKQKDENGNFIMEYNDYKGGMDYVISLEGCQLLLNEHMAKHAASVNDFANRHGITFTQGEFDALVSLSFNIGASFLSESKKDWHIHKALASGDKGAYLAYAFALYSTSGGVTTQGHLKRRLLELDMFLYNKYDTNKGWPTDLRYILFDGNGGTTEYNPHGFNVNYPVSDFWVTFTQTPTGTDANGNSFTYEFAGWFNQPVGGEQITVLDASLESGMVLYAHWRNPTTGQIDDLRPGTAVDVKVKATSSNVTLREGPCAYYHKVRSVYYSGELLHITRIVTGKDKKEWGLTAEGWVRLDYTTYGTTGGGSSSDTTTNTGVLKNAIGATVDGDNVNIRTGPGTNYGKTGTQYDSGQRVTITEIRNGEDGQASRQWGKMSDGSWICMNYVKLDSTPEFEGAEQTPVDPTAPDVSDAFTVTKIVMEEYPNKLQYPLGGSESVPDLTGAEITATYSNGKRKWSIDITRGMITGFDNSKPGVNTITVTFGGATTTFDVQIVPNQESVARIELLTLPNKGLYLLGESLDLNGCVLRIYYAHGGYVDQEVTAGMVTGFDSTTVGNKTVTITHEGFAATFNVDIVDRMLGLSMQSQPDKHEYLVGDSLDLTGAAIAAEYQGAGVKIIPVTKEMVSGYDSSVPGVQKLTVAYGGFTTTFDIEVFRDEIVGISMCTPPSKDEYLVGEELDLSGAAIRVQYSYSDSKNVPLTKDMVTGFDSTVLGTKTLTVSYQGHTTTFFVKVIDNETTGISINTYPQKTQYLLGEGVLDLTGASITVKRINSEDIIPLTEEMVSGFDNTVVGRQRLTITYEGLIAYLDIEIVEDRLLDITVDTKPSKDTYRQGIDHLDVTGMKIAVRYRYSGVQIVSVKPEMVSGFNNAIAGVQRLTVTYKGCQVAFDVEILEDRITEISVNTAPEKQQYLQGVENLDVTGAMLSVHYAYAGVQNLAITPDMVIGFDNLTGGIKTLTVAYKGYTTTFTVEIVLHTVVFQNYDGTVLQSTQHALGEVVTPPQTPTKPTDQYGEYEFAGWDKQVTNCGGSATYTAIFVLKYPKGDVDRNMKVDEDDAIYLLWHVFFPADYPVAVTPDYDNNGTLNEDDAIYLLWHVFFPEDYPLN